LGDIKTSKRTNRRATLKTKWWKILFSVVACAVLDVILHRLFAPRIEYNFPPSVFVEKGLFLPAASVALILWFGTLTGVFSLIQHRLPGDKAMKGWRYGIAFGVLCFLGIFEMSIIFDSSAVDELRTSVADAISILMLGIFLGRFAGTDSQNARKESKIGWRSIIPIPLAFLIGRYFGYGIVHIMSAYTQKPIATFLWTLGIGCWIAVTLFLLKERDQKSSAVRAFRFGFLIFGSYWLIYNLFVLVFVRVSVLDIFARVIIDVLSVTVGTWVANRLSLMKTTVTGQTVD
jgi:hypothetical protein